MTRTCGMDQGLPRRSRHRLGVAILAGVGLIAAGMEMPLPAAPTVVGGLFVAACAPAQTAVDTPVAVGSWSQFMGPHRNGVSDEAGLMDRWPEQGPPVLWRVGGGVGMSGVVIHEDRAFTLVQRSGRQWLIALRAEDGKAVWQADLAPEYENAMGDGPRATPCVAAGRVLAFTGEGVLAAVSAKDGRVLWSASPLKELEGREADYGMASSPLVVGDEVIVTVGAPRATLAAYDLHSGKRRWTAGNDPAGYSSPVLRQVGGRSQIVAFTGNSALGVAPGTGEVLWRYPFVTNYDCNIALPLEYQGQLFLSAGENHGCVLLSLTSGPGAYDLRARWESLGASSVLRSEWQTPVLSGRFLYGMDNVGGAGPITHLTCVDIATGERRWQQPRFGKGNLIAADGKLFLTTMKGELIVARMSPERYEELGRATLLESTRQAPSLAGGRLFLRDDRDIVCVDVRRR